MVAAVLEMMITTRMVEARMLMVAVVEARSLGEEIWPASAELLLGVTERIKNLTFFSISI